jgi:SH3-like domain-containing protein
MKNSFKIILLISTLFFNTISINAYSQEKEAKNKIPRFVSTRSDEINVRTGPGVRYPIKWVIVRDKMPLEVIAEFEDWRKVRDFEQAEGWVHRAMLSPKRTALVKDNQKSIYSKKDKKSSKVAVANKGTLLSVKECDGFYCEVEAKSVDGYIEIKNLWGVYENEKIED